MGIYDDIKIELPLAEGLESLVDFQTKSFDRRLEQYLLGSDRMLRKVENEREWVDDPSSLFGGHPKVTSTKIVPYAYTGQACVYAAPETGWVEYTLTFEAGFLVCWVPQGTPDPEER
jgi:hypothetical protein